MFLLGVQPSCRAGVSNTYVSKRDMLEGLFSLKGLSGANVTVGPLPAPHAPANQRQLKSQRAVRLGQSPLESMSAQPFTPAGISSNCRQSKWQEQAVSGAVLQPGQVVNLCRLPRIPSHWDNSHGWELGLYTSHSSRQFLGAVCEFSNPGTFQ